MNDCAGSAGRASRSRCRTEHSDVIHECSALGHAAVLVDRPVLACSGARLQPSDRRGVYRTVTHVSVDVFGVLRPAPPVRATGRQGPPCSASTRSPKQRHARPKHLEVLAGTMRSGVLALSLPNSIAEMQPSPSPRSWCGAFKHRAELGPIVRKSSPARNQK